MVSTGDVPTRLYTALESWERLTLRLRVRGGVGLNGWLHAMERYFAYHSLPRVRSRNSRLPSAALFRNLYAEVRRIPGVSVPSSEDNSSGDGSGVLGDVSSEECSSGAGEL